MTKSGGKTIIHVDELYCKGCLLCLHCCPKKIIAKSNKRNDKGYSIPYVGNLEECTRCKTCELICPELAVTVEEVAS